MADLLILGLYIGIVAGFYLIAGRIFNKGDIEIPEQSRHEHRHLLHRDKGKNK